MAGRKKKRKSHFNWKFVHSLAFLAVIAAVIVGMQYLEPYLSDNKETSQAYTNPIVTDAELEVHYLDVGQGNAALVRIPAAEGYHHMLVDTGTAAYADEVGDYLENLGVSRIDTLIGTHQHADHIGGMEEIINRFEIGQVFMPRLPEDLTPATRTYEALLDTLESHRLSINELGKDVYIDVPLGSQIQVFSPEKGAFLFDDMNDYSGVFRLVYGRTAFLFTGDAEVKVEKELINSNADIRANALSCGHHGSSSSTSENFLRAVSPEYAIISSGSDNTYGHPHKETLARLDAYGCRTLRTDQMGHIVLCSDGETIREKNDEKAN